MTPRERFELTVNHRQPDRMVVDFGATSVTGIHVLAIENLRKHYGLAYQPVRVVDPYQMLGEVDEELGGIMGTDVVAARGRKNAFGLSNHEPLKEYLTPWRQTVLVPESFNTTTNEKGDVLVYPEGDLTAGPSARMPSDGYFFDAVIRQKPFNEEDLDPEDNLEEYGLVTGNELELAAAAKPGQSAYNVAVADFFRAPDIEEVDLTAYGGQVGDVIRIKATDDFKVQQVSVRIKNADASLIEEGQAVADPDGRSWIYTATAVNESLTGDKITVTATDRPQNVSREEQVLE